jgi:hypothetical protein
MGVLGLHTPKPCSTALFADVGIFASWCGGLLGVPIVSPLQIIRQSPTVQFAPLQIGFRGVRSR